MMFKGYKERMGRLKKIDKDLADDIYAIVNLRVWLHSIAFIAGFYLAEIIIRFINI